MLSYWVVVRFFVDCFPHDHKMSAAALNIISLQGSLQLDRISGRKNRPFIMVLSFSREKSFSEAFNRVYSRLYQKSCDMSNKSQLYKEQQSCHDSWTNFF